MNVEDKRSAKHDSLYLDLDKWVDRGIVLFPEARENGEKADLGKQSIVW